MGSVCVSGLPCDVCCHKTQSNISNIDLCFKFKRIQQCHLNTVLELMCVAVLSGYQEFSAHWKWILNTYFPYIIYFPDFIWKLLSDYNQANEKCLLRISSTCWRDAVGVTNPQSSNRSIWSRWFAFLGWLLTPCEDSGYSHGRLQNFGIGFQCEAERGTRESGTHCYPLLSEEVFGKWSSCSEWWLVPATFSTNLHFIVAGTSSIHLAKHLILWYVHFPWIISFISYFPTAFCLIFFASFGRHSFNLKYMCWH